MEAKEVLRRAKRMNIAQEPRFSALALGDVATALDAEGSEYMLAAYRYLKDADWDLDRAIALAEKEEGS